MDNGLLIVLRALHAIEMRQASMETRLIAEFSLLRSEISALAKKDRPAWRVRLEQVRALALMGGIFMLVLSLLGGILSPREAAELVQLLMRSAGSGG